MINDKPFTLDDFNKIYSKVPRLTVEVLLYQPTQGVYLTLRDIEPCKDQWHLPGGTVLYGENLTQAVKRVAKRELGISVESSEMVGYIEYPSHYQDGNDHPVGLVFLVKDYTGKLRAETEARDGRWHKVLPPAIHADQDVFLVNNNYIQAE
jgi:ADP-ribose pyrophosphatase YjhB (NUDIX family)